MDRPRLGITCRSIRTAPLLVLLAGALAGCRDVAPPTAPSPQMLAEQPGVTAASHAADSAKAAVIVERVLTVKRKGGGQTVKKVRQSWTVPLSAAPTLEATLVMPRVGGDRLTVDSLWTALPLGLIRVAAVSADVECRRDGELHRRFGASDSRTVSRGNGAESIEESIVTSGGTVVGRVHATWRRLPNSWILVSHEFESSDGSYSDVTTLRHFDAHGSADRLTISNSSCAMSRSNSQARQLFGRDTTALQTATFSSIGQTDPHRFSRGLAAASCDVPSDADVDAGACLPEFLILSGATSAFMFAFYQVISKCLLPEKVLLVDCTPAVDKLNNASIALSVALLAYRHCKEAAQRPPEECSCNASRVGRTDTPAAAVAAPTPSDPIAQPTADCLPGESGGTGTGGGGSEPVWYEIMICTFEDHYDEFGKYLYSVNKGCSYQLAMM